MDVQTALDRLSSSLLNRITVLPPDLPPPPPYPHADQYVLASLIQKAVRRGSMDIARRAGRQLLAVDPGRLWRRLRVIAVEDIGLGDPAAMIDMVAITSSATLRRRLGSNTAALDNALCIACLAAKERSVDHLHSLAQREPLPDANQDRLRRASDHALVAVLLSSHHDMAERARAAALLAERTDTLTIRQRLERLHPTFQSFRDLGASGDLIAAVQVCTGREGALLPLYLLLAWALHLNGGAASTITQHEPPPAASIDGLPAFGLDPHHTRIGRRAVQLWYRSYLKPPPWTPRQIGMALWNVEAAACDQTLDWPTGLELRRRAYRADLLACDVPEHRHPDLYCWVMTEQDALTSARQAAWRSAIRP
jgi:hypothetical protein